MSDEALNRCQYCEADKDTRMIRFYIREDFGDPRVPDELELAHEVFESALAFIAFNDRPGRRRHWHTYSVTKGT